MIDLKTTSDTVVMLLIAGGVGLLGGIGAGLLENQRTPKANSKAWWATVGSSVVLGAIAAVAILYFFPPEETVITTVGETTTSVTQYNLTKLVALALIVGSAGSGFLIVLQTRALALSNAKQADAAQATAKQALTGVGDQAPSLAKASVEAAAPTVQKALEEASTGGPGQVTSDVVAKVVEELGNQAKESMQESIEPVVEGAQKTVQAATAPAPATVDPTLATATAG